MPSTVRFDAATEIPPLAEKIILITGGTAGLGRETVLAFAAHAPGHIYFTGRSRASADKLINDVRAKFPSTGISFVPCDLTSLAAIQTAARELTTQVTRLDICIANAGIMATPFRLTKEGYEEQFGTNHVGHALLVKLLTPVLESTSQRFGDARLVWLSSVGYAAHPNGGIDFDQVKLSAPGKSSLIGNNLRYASSKLANLLYSRAYAKHHPSITSVAVHPGVSWTGLVNHLPFGVRMTIYALTFLIHLPPEQCAWNQQWAATAPKGSGNRQVQSGQYYEPVGKLISKPMRLASDDALEEKLWQWTEKELRSYTL